MTQSRIISESKAARVKANDIAWGKLVKALQEHNRKKATIYIPICVGYEGALKAEELSAILSSINDFNLDQAAKGPAAIKLTAKVLLSPNDEYHESCEKWLVQNLDSQNDANQFMMNDEWRKSDRYAKAKIALETLLANPEYERQFAEKLEMDVTDYATHPKHRDLNVDREAIKQHVIGDVIDYISFMVGDEDSLSALIYPFPKKKSMLLAHELAVRLGYLQWGGILVHHQRNAIERILKAVKEAVRLEAQSISQNKDGKSDNRSENQLGQDFSLSVEKAYSLGVGALYLAGADEEKLASYSVTFLAKVSAMMSAQAAAAKAAVEAAEQVATPVFRARSSSSAASPLSASSLASRNTSPESRSDSSSSLPRANAMSDVRYSTSFAALFTPRQATPITREPTPVSPGTSTPSPAALAAASPMSPSANDGSQRRSLPIDVPVSANTTPSSGISPADADSPSTPPRFK